MANNVTRWVSKDDNPPNLMLAIDPGASTGGKTKVPYAGVALFQWGTLVWAGLVKSSTTAPPFARGPDLVRRILEASGVPACEHANGEPLDMLAVEVPRIYTKMRARPEDIIQLALIAGCCISGIPAKRYSLPRPSEWKSNIDGDIFLNRVIGIRDEAGWHGGVLSSGEHLVLTKAEIPLKKAETSHVRDAIALGCWVAGRIDTGGVF